MLEQLCRRELLVVTGKGGVGKTVLAAALGLALAGLGRRVLLLEVDPRESLHQLLALPPSGGATLRVERHLAFQNLRPRDVVDALVREQVGVRLIVRRVLRSPVYEHFVEGAPGLEQMAVLGHAYRALRGQGVEERPDVVVLDAPATGHGVSLMAAPNLVAEALDSGPFGRLARELADFVADPARCGVTAVTTAEEMPVQEVLELIGLLAARTGRAPEAVFVNELYPPGPGDDEPADPAGRVWAARRAVNERELARLRSRWSGPIVELPLLPRDRGPRLVRELEALLVEQLRAAPGRLS
jgi:anion-transporting  ArsA/GET3 family ATPase